MFFVEITRTINSDRRYYFDEQNIVNPDSLVNTICRFNDIKFQLYNRLYDKSFLKKGPLMDMTYSQWLKDHFQTNDYYNCLLYNEASAMVSSQRELKKLYVKTKEEDLKTRDTKIKSVKTELDKKRGIKESIRIYLKTGKWKKPYPKSRLYPAGGSIILPGGKKVPVLEYERTVEDSIRKLKNRLSYLSAARERAAKKLEDLESHPPHRVIFGTKKRYKQKDLEDTDMDAWREEFRQARHASMSLSGRRTSKRCNFLVRREKEDLVVMCMDGKETILKNFHLSRYHDIWAGMLNEKLPNRRPVCYNFKICRDPDGRAYFLVSVTIILENRYCNDTFLNGCVSIDLNYDHVAVSNLDKDGNRLGGKVFRFDLEGKTAGQISETIGQVMLKVGEYCTKQKKPLVMEDIDTTISKHGMKYGNRTRNLHASMFAYRKMTTSLENQSYKQNFGILKINPAYTSQMGKFLYMRKMGISIHEAASYTIGLKGMEKIDRLMPDARLVSLLPENVRNELQGKHDIISLCHAWRRITDAFKGVPTHSFYRELPFDALNGKKRGTLRTISSEMKSWTEKEYY